MGFIWMIIVGLVAGLLARAIKPGNDAMGYDYRTRDRRSDTRWLYRWTDWY